MTLLKKNILYNKLVCALNKKGHKQKGISLIYDAFFRASKKLKVTFCSLIHFIFLKLVVFIEIKDVHRRGKIFKIPFPTSRKRKTYLAFKWFTNSIIFNKRPMSFSDKMYFEILNLYFKKKSKSYLFKIQNNKLAVANRSNSHFRW